MVNAPGCGPGIRGFETRQSPHFFIICMKYISNSIEGTKLIAKKILNQHLGSKRIIILNGPIGAGKTELVKYISEFMNEKDKVTSPTFGIKKEYSNFIHYDLYMSKKINSNEFISMIEEDVEDKIVIIEWGNKISKKNLSNYLEIFINIKSETEREFIIG